MNIITCDVLVVGGGLAASSAIKNLLDAHPELDLCMAVKGTFGVVGQRGSGASACGTSETGTPHSRRISESDEERERWYKRIIQAGLGLADPKVAEVMLEEAPKVKLLLQKWGITFGAEGPYHLGYPFVHSIEHELRASKVQLCENTMIADVLKDDGQCVGAVGVTGTEEVVLFKTPSIIFATGGDAQLFRDNVHPPCVTGDGYAAGFRAGAELMNLEFMQIFFSTVHPTRNLFHVRHKKVLEYVYNTENHEFIADYLPEGIGLEECLEENLKHAPFSTRDRASRYLAIAIVKEIQAGRGTEHGGIFFDVTAGMEGVRDVQDRFLRSRNIDLRTSPVEITMAHQCSNGGLRVDTDAMTTIPGVFAAGEASTGMHGTDRLGGHMLLCCLAFGKRSAESAAKWAKSHSIACDVVSIAKEQLDEIQAIASSGGGTSPDTLLHRLQNSAWNHALTVRSEQSLHTLLSDISQLREEFKNALSVQYPGALIDALELRNLFLVGELVATAAKHRKESRGGHYREDYPKCDAHNPVKAIVLNASEDRTIQLREEVLDPDWQDNEENLGKGRWG
ncbi:MAG: FAD-binding protein [bacterium]|nr:FAD-binding protein [bacterium]